MPAMRLAAHVAAFVETMLVAAACAWPAAVFAHGETPGNHHGPNLDFVEKPFGQTGDPKKVVRTVRVRGDDTMRFMPTRISVRQGETLRIVFINAGKSKHEAVLGTMADLKEHAVLMQKFPGMEHDEPFMVHSDPGQSGEMIWQFTRSGEFHFGCLMPGHFEAGMVGSIVVTPRAASNPSKR
jgi:uncharacterized cupredoxin-like copper-binding protein